MFFVLALPRSRTKWLSAFLTHGSITCHHEYVGGLDSLDDAAELGDNGTAETFGTLVWRQLYSRFPNAGWVIVKRRPMEVDASLRRQGYVVNVDQLNCTLSMAAKAIPALVVNFEDIDTRLREIWAHCRGDAFPEGREAMAAINIAEPIVDQLARVDPKRLRRLQCSK